jgi:DNA-binding response OmpR family regulator
MKILYADDDADLVDLTTYVLLRHGHRVIAAADGVQALQRFTAEQPDLVLVDALMPSLGGFEVCRRIREAGQTPIIIISALRDEADVVRGYESGADDYIVKPFSPRQLLLRIDALMRRVTGTQGSGNGHHGSRVDLGDMAVDPAAHEARKNGVRLPLTRLEFRILHYLVSNAGALVEAQRLAEYAWQSPTSGDASLLKTHVSHIRQKLADAGGEPLQIRAIPRTGYILAVSQPAGYPATPLLRRPAVQLIGATVGRVVSGAGDGS